jgi:hypothetical protein
MRKSTLLLLATVAAVSLPLYARDGGGDRPVIPRAGETVEVSIVNVDVVVTDRKGNHVHGLTRNDFEIYEDRKLQPVSNFAEYVGENESAPMDAAINTSIPRHPSIESAPRPKRTILVFIDHFSLAPGRKERFFNSLKTLLHETIAPGDAVSIVSWNKMVATRLPFTDDLAALDSALAKLELESTFLSPDLKAQVDRERLWRAEASAMAAQKGFSLAESSFDTKSEAGQDEGLFEKLRMRNKVASMRSLVTGISAFEGRKVLLFVTNRFSRVTGNDGTSPMMGSYSGRGGDYDMFNLIESLGRTAATNNVTIYSLYPPGLDITTDSAEFSTANDAHAYISLDNQLSALNLLADRTGGATAWGVENIAEFLPHLREDLDSYYSLAYRATASGSNRDRSIVVKMKNRAYTARARRDYVDKSPEAKMKDRVIASLFREASGARIPITVTAGEARKQSNHRWTVAVHVEIPIASLTTLPQTAEHSGAFSVYVAWGGVLGELSDVTRQTQSFAIPDARQEEAVAGHYNYDFPLDVDERTKSVVIGVVDEVSQEFGIGKIELPPRT